MGQWDMRRFIASFAHCLIGVLLVAGCSTPPGNLSIALADSASGAIVRVTGLSSSEIARLRGLAAADDAWPALLRVTVTGADTPVLGKYVIAGTSLEFHPRFPFDKGRSYTLQFDPARMPEPRDAPVLRTTAAIAGPSAVPSTVVTKLSPTGGSWPENLLRFYIHFSAPMSRANALGFVRLVDDAGRDVPEALLEVDVDLWNDDRTRHTVFFDPGRVKRGVRPNVELGRALRAGRRYAIVIDAAWRDASGQPLASPFRHEFVAGPAVEAALDLASWQIAAPAANTRDPLVVRFPWPLDGGLLQRTMGVARAGSAPLDGAIHVEAAETSWRFVPAVPWRSGPHELIVLTLLEDPSGNKVGQPFEIEMFERPAQALPDQQALPFQIK